MDERGGGLEGTWYSDLIQLIPYKRFLECTHIQLRQSIYLVHTGRKGNLLNDIKFSNIHFIWKKKRRRKIILHTSLYCQGNFCNDKKKTRILCIEIFTLRTFSIFCSWYKPNNPKIFIYLYIYPSIIRLSIYLTKYPSIYLSNYL